MQMFEILLPVLSSLPQIPGLSGLLQIPGLSGLLQIPGLQIPGLSALLNMNGIAGKISGELRAMFGAKPTPPPLPTGYHYGKYPSIEILQTDYTNEEIEAIGQPRAQNNVYKPAVGKVYDNYLDDPNYDPDMWQGQPPMKLRTGKYPGRDFCGAQVYTVINRENYILNGEGIPVARWIGNKDPQKCKVVEVLGFAKSGEAITDNRTIKYIGQDIDPPQPHRIGRMRTW